MIQGQTEAKIKCCKCGKMLDGFSGLQGDDGPSDGDITVCFYCGTIGNYAEGLTKIVPMPEEALERMKKESFEDYVRLMLAVKGIKDRIYKSRKQQIDNLDFTN